MSGTRVVYLDVDGTIIDHEQRLAPSVVRAVRGAQRAGHFVFVCTGRSRAEILGSVIDIGFDGYISAGGGFVERDGELLEAATMAERDAHDLVQFFRAHDIEYTLQGYDDVYASEGLLERLLPLLPVPSGRTPGGAAIADALPEHEAEAERELADDMQLLVERLSYRGPAPLRGIAKATFLGLDDRTFAAVRDGVGARFHVITGSIPYLGQSGGEVSLHGMHKGAAIVRMTEALGLPMSASIAIGDSMNDIEMLDMAGLGIAMGDAPPDVVAHADELTASVHDDGVWRAFVKHGLIDDGEPTH